MRLNLLPTTATVQPARKPRERLREGQGMAEGAYSENTLLLFRLFESPRTSERANFSGLSMAQIEYH
jgi:hypothetical protein